MMYTSQDILFLILALCAAFLTVFLCMLLYQAYRTLKNANVVVEDLRDKLDQMNQAMLFIQNKVDSVSNHVGLMQGAVGNFVEKFVLGAIGKQLKKKFTSKEEVEEDNDFDDDDLEAAFDAMVKKKKGKRKKK